MLYGIIRCILVILLLLLYIILARKWLKKKWKKMISFSLIIAFSLSIWILPFENLFLKFDSIEAVFRYSGNGKIIKTVEGKDSALAITKNGKANSHFLVLKQDNCYKIAMPYYLTKISENETEELTITLFQVKGSNDFYLDFRGVVEHVPVITDCYGTVFDAFSEPVPSTKYELQLFICVSSIEYTEDYYCVLNGERIDFR